jgi:hypothetical protein
MSSCRIGGVSSMRLTVLSNSWLSAGADFSGRVVRFAFTIPLKSG